MSEIIEFKNVNKIFKSEKSEIKALEDINLTVNSGEILGIIGFSGAGKSTLLRSINALEIPESGEVNVCGETVNKLKSKQLLALRRKIGMIFQNFNLMQQKTVLKNVLFPLEVAGVKRSDALQKAKALLEDLGISDKAASFPSQLSGGQKQRVAIARALALNPQILLCDEATSALDPETASQILEILSNINQKYNLTIVLITHQLSVVRKICTRVAVLENGRICETGDVKSVFSSPSSDAAKRLVAYSRGEL